MAVQQPGCSLDNPGVVNRASLSWQLSLTAVAGNRVDAVAAHL